MKEPQGESRVRWNEASRQIADALLSGENFGTTLQTIAEQARTVSGASIGAILHPSAGDPRELTVEVLDAPDPAHRWLAESTIPVEGTATGVAFSTGKALVVRQDGVFVPDGPADRVPGEVSDLASVMAVPLVFGGEKLGVLLVARLGEQQPFTDADVDTIRQLAVYAAVTMELARADADRHHLAILQDRERVGRDLQELVIQRLFGVGLGLRELNRPEVDRCVTEIDRTIRDLRNSVVFLREIDREGSFRSELLALARETAPALGFRPTVVFDGPVEAVVTGSLRADVIAAVRESLANVARHAAADSVSVEAIAERDGRRFTLTVTDDGAGLPDVPEPGGGLANLAERAARRHGNCTLERAPGGGTRLTWTAEVG